MKKQVTVFGASGLIGGFLIQNLIEDVSISKIHLVSRNSKNVEHEKIVVHLIDFLNSTEIENCVRESTTVFSAIGTTQARVGGDKAAYRKIDYDINCVLQSAV